MKSFAKVELNYCHHRDGLRGVKAKVPQKHIYVEYEPAKVEQEALQKAVERAGFTAVEV